MGANFVVLEEMRAQLQAGFTTRMQEASGKEFALYTSMLFVLVALAALLTWHRRRPTAMATREVVPQVPAPSVEVNKTGRRRSDSPAPQSENDENAKTSSANDNLPYRLDTIVKEKLGSISGLGEKNVRMRPVV